MAWSDQSFQKRYAVMGDMAETIYLEATPLGNTTRFGFRRPDGIKFSNIPEGMRHMPDFITSSYLVEVMGLGKDGVLKSMKTTKYEALKEWNKFAGKMGLLGVVLFIWNSYDKQFIILSWKDIVDEVAYSKRTDGVQSFKNDGNEYYPLRWERLVAKAATIGDWDV
jgi:hypothetical protein